MTDSPKNLGASVRQRLLNLSRASGTDFVVTLSNYALERLLYRLSCSQHRDRFVLKGAMLFRIWSDEPHRATRDMDLLAFGSPATEEIARIFREACRLEVDDDGVAFQPESVRTEDIREAQEYDGIRVRMTAMISQARASLKIDVGFGDAVVPHAEETPYPTLLDFPAPTIRAYARETVIAEKFHAMVSLGIANSRMKDFYDLYALATSCEFSGSVICSAIRATFERRTTPMPSAAPIALTTEFSKDTTKMTQWRAFVTGGSVGKASSDLSEVVAMLGLFLLPPVNSLSAGQSFEKKWVPPGPWVPEQMSG